MCVTNEVIKDYNEYQCVLEIHDIMASPFLKAFYCSHYTLLNVSSLWLLVIQLPLRTMLILNRKSRDWLQWGLPRSACYHNCNNIDLFNTWCYLFKKIDTMKKFSSPALLLVLLSKDWFIFIIGILPWTSNHSILSSLRKLFSYFWYFCCSQF